ncbi:MAG: NAD(P)-binding protein [Caldilineaceae bacterium]|nr:NAD(P)-binding protein [Caldilineaceae bacterium]
MDNQSADLLIIGAGLTGLMLATALVEQGDPRRILLVDKGRSVGGRLATRRMGGGRADHGAQFFTVRDKHFEHYVNKWLAAELVFPWSVGWSNGSTDATPNDGHPRYAVRGGMNALAKHLAGALADAPNVTIATDVRIAADRRGDSWRRDHRRRHAGRGDRGHSTPVPQGLDLLDGRRQAGRGRPAVGGWIRALSVRAVRGRQRGHVAGAGRGAGAEHAHHLDCGQPAQGISPGDRHHRPRRAGLEPRSTAPDAEVEPLLRRYNRSCAAAACAQKSSAGAMRCQSCCTGAICRRRAAALLRRRHVRRPRWRRGALQAGVEQRARQAKRTARQDHELRRYGNLPDDLVGRRCHAESDDLV